MKNHLKLLYTVSLILLFNEELFSQTDLIGGSHKKNKSVFITGSIGIPIFNQLLLYNHFEKVQENKAFSKSKLMCNLNLDFNKNHFTLNSFVSYIQNEYNGNSYHIDGGYQIGTRPNATQKYFDVYQHVKYNYIQIGLGCGYNKSFKKNNFSLITNLAYNAYTDINYSTNFSTNSSLNDNDTLKISLEKNKHFDHNDVFSLAFYLYFKISYNYMLSEKISICTSLNSSVGYLEIYGLDDGVSASQDLGNQIRGQKIIYPTLGLKYKLK